MSKNRVYLDAAATQLTRPQVTAAMQNVSAQCGNPSSHHDEGRRARAVLEEARERVAACLSVPTDYVVFTSSGTESNNMVLQSIVLNRLRRGQKSHLLVSQIEHKSVQETAVWLNQFDGVSVDWIPVTSGGLVDSKEIATMLRKETVLVSVMGVNNETGCRQPIAAIATQLKAHPAHFHCDAVQWIGRAPFAMTGIDYVTGSGHKWGGPNGVGLLLCRHPISALLHGGPQERMQRAGTEAVSLAVGLAEALQLTLAELVAEEATFSKKQQFLTALLAVVPYTENGEKTVSTIANLSFEGIDAETMVTALDLEGVSVSTGSACSTGSMEPSMALKAMALSPSRLQSAVRFSWLPSTPYPNFEAVISRIKAVANRYV